MIKFQEKIAYGFGDMASSMFWKIFGMYLLFFYTKVFGISPAAAGTMFLITRVWDSFIDPVMGILADRTHSRWGKYRPYLLWFAVPFGLIGILTFYTPPWNENGRLIYAYVTYTLMMMIYTAINVPYASLLGVISPHPNERNILSSYRMFFAYGGSLITFMLLQPMIDYFTNTFGGTHERPVQLAWTAAVGVIGAICAVLFFLCFKWTKERVTEINQDKKNATITGDLKKLATNAPWWILLGAGVAALLFNSIRDGVALFYFNDYVQENYKMTYTGWTLGTIFLLIGQAANMIGVALAAPVSNRIGKKNTYILAMAIASVLSAIFFGFKSDQFMLIFLFQVLISVCAGIIFPLLWSMYADIVDYQELKTGRRSTGLIFSSSSMSQKLGWALGGAMSGWLLAAFGYNQDAAVQPWSAVNGVRLMMSWLPAISCLLAVIGMAFYPLSEKRVLQISKELNERRKLWQ